jgi:hypothetical protein
MLVNYEQACNYKSNSRSVFSILELKLLEEYKQGQEIVSTSTGVAKIKRYWIASTKTPGLDLASPTAHIACSSPLYSGH